MAKDTGRYEHCRSRGEADNDAEVEQDHMAAVVRVIVAKG